MKILGAGIKVLPWSKDQWTSWIDDPCYIIGMSEKEIKDVAAARLRQLGFRVLRIWGNNRVRGGFRGQATPGTPDMFVSRTGNVWLGLEFKRPDREMRASKRTPESSLRRVQQELAQGGFTTIVKSAEEAIERALDHDAKQKTLTLQK